MEAFNDISRSVIAVHTHVYS